MPLHKKSCFQKNEENEEKCEKWAEMGRNGFFTSAIWVLMGVGRVFIKGKKKKANR